MNESEKSDFSPRSKRRYERPAFVVVALRPDEAVLGSCKSATASGAGTVGRCGNPTPCNSLGS